MKPRRGLLNKKNNGLRIFPRIISISGFCIAASVSIIVIAVHLLYSRYKLFNHQANVGDRKKAIDQDFQIAAAGIALLSRSGSYSSFPHLRTEAVYVENNKSERRRARIGFAITITKDGFFQDGAAVLAYSIIKISIGKNHDISLVAFVHPNVTEARPKLRNLGYTLSKIVPPTEYG